MFLGFVIIAPAFGFMGALIDRIGARRVLRVGILLVALPLILMGWMTRLWEYYVLCIVEVVGYVLAGPISNQVLVSNWFRAKRGRAMGYAYLGLGLGGVAAPVLAAHLIDGLGWRRAFVIIGAMIAVVLFPVAQWLTRSAPGEMGLVADGVEPAPGARGSRPGTLIPIRGGGSNRKFLAHPRGQHAHHRRHRNRDSTIRPVPSRRRVHHGPGLARLQRIAFRGIGRTGGGGLSGGPLQQEERHGVVLSRSSRWRSPCSFWRDSLPRFGRSH